MWTGCLLGFPINHELRCREPVFLPRLPTPVFGNRAYEVNLVVGATFLELVSGHIASVYQMLARKHLSLGQVLLNVSVNRKVDHVIGELLSSGPYQQFS